MKSQLRSKGGRGVASLLLSGVDGILSGHRDFADDV